MQAYAVIVENDVTQWQDDTGTRYHFPKRYARFIQPGTNLLHYKGKLTDKAHAAKRMSPEPHYFATSVAGEHEPDPASERGDLFLRIEDYLPFTMAVPHRIDGDTLEIIPASRVSNFWRDGVRPTEYKVFARVANLAGLLIDVEEQDASAGADVTELTTALPEGNRILVYGTRLERRPELRAKAVELHGTSCFACEAKMQDIYGDAASGYIHIHHRKPLSRTGPTLVDPVSDLVPLCPNCHSIAHLGGALRTVNDIRELLGKPALEKGGH